MRPALSAARFCCSRAKLPCSSSSSSIVTQVTHVTTRVSTGIRRQHTM
jgi:hypothetical protein